MTDVLPTGRRGRTRPLRGACLLAACLQAACLQDASQQLQRPPSQEEPYLLHTGLRSRSISFENPTGQPGAGGQAKSPLGQGRKGAPARMIAKGQTVTLADIRGRGTIRHIWMTTYRRVDALRGAVIRGYWDGQEHPSVEAPLGDFFGFAHGHSEAFQTAVHSVGPGGGMNIWLPMPFRRSARFTLSNEGKRTMPLFFQIDYTLGDRHPEDVGRLHVLFRRENPTLLGHDFELLPRRRGRGRYLGAIIGVRPQRAEWWGEGEVKMYLDGDRKFPTIVGTGTEDYVGLAWGLRRAPFLYHGATAVQFPSGADTGPVSIYRWHLQDPVYWARDARVTLQQIGLRHQPGTPPDTIPKYLAGLMEREDDWSAATFWYEAIPSAPLPPLPDLAARMADLPL